MFAKNPQLVSPDQVRKEMQGRALNHEVLLPPPSSSSS